jgi:ABC-type transport system involved in cytochrome bd biosynthesis fused ATPase/permease subunit
MMIVFDSIPVTDWIQAACFILTTITAFFGINKSISNISKDINKNANERLDKLENQLKEHVRGYSEEAALNTWKRLVELYSTNPKMHEYSSLNSDKK